MTAIIINLLAGEKRRDVTVRLLDALTIKTTPWKASGSFKAAASVIIPPCGAVQVKIT